MRKKNIYQEVSIVLEQGRKDLARCLEVINDHEAEIMDIFRYHGVISVVLSQDVIFAVEEDLRARKIPARIYRGVVLKNSKNSDARCSSRYQAVSDITDTGISFNSQHVPLHFIATWYAYQFERRRVRDDDLMPLLLSSEVCDIVTSVPAQDYPEIVPEYTWSNQFLQSMRVIAVVGSSGRKPHGFTLPDSIMEDSEGTLGIPIENEKFFVYYVYNLNMDEQPCLVMFKSRFLRKHYRKLKWREISIRKVAQGIQTCNIMVHTLPRYTISIKRLLRTFFAL